MIVLLKTKRPAPGFFRSAAALLFMAATLPFVPQMARADDADPILSAGLDTNLMTLEAPDPKWADNLDLFQKVEKVVTACLDSCHAHEQRRLKFSIPSISGQKQSYIYKQLRDFDKNNHVNVRHYLRADPSMDKVSNKVDDDLFVYISDYVSKLTCVNYSAEQTQGQKPKGLGTCASCHGEDGLGASAHIPRLAGQSLRYMSKQLELFRSTDRLKPYPAHSPIRRSHLMTGDKLDVLSEKLVLRYYARLPCGG